MKEITYIPDEEFTKLTKKQKLEIPQAYSFEESEIHKLVISPSNRKNDGYFLGDFFAFTEGKGWWRPTTYDCWSIVTDLENPANLRYTLLKGDFENGGVQIFYFLDEHHKAYISYGGQITIRRKL
jgi:hypothetical protein